MKILGVIVDNKLTWEKHINKIKKQTHKTIANLARTTHVLPLKSRKTLYDALVTPHLNYCDIIWDGTSVTNAKALQKTGNFAAKALLGLKRKSSGTEALKKLNMVPLWLKRKIHMGVFVHKMMHSNGPKSIADRYKDKIKRTHSHHTRAAARADMQITAHKTSRFKLSTQHRAVRCWNDIPIDLRAIPDTSVFKRRYQSLLVNNFKYDKGCLHSHCR